jgi:hypothetical protein
MPSTCVILRCTYRRTASPDVIDPLPSIAGFNLGGHDGGTCARPCSVRHCLCQCSTQRRAGRRGVGAQEVRGGRGLYWNNIGQTLERDRSLRPHYKELMAALNELDSAIAKARSASDRLMRAADAWGDNR